MLARSKDRPSAERVGNPYGDVAVALSSAEIIENRQLKLLQVPGNLLGLTDVDRYHAPVKTRLKLRRNAIHERLDVHDLLPWLVGLGPKQGQELTTAISLGRKARIVNIFSPVDERNSRNLDRRHPLKRTIREDAELRQLRVDDDRLNRNNPNQRFIDAGKRRERKRKNAKALPDRGDRQQ
jgi:hypothetical protein